MITNFLPPFLIFVAFLYLLLKRNDVFSWILSLEILLISFLIFSFNSITLEKSSDLFIFLFFLLLISFLQIIFYVVSTGSLKADNNNEGGF